MKYVQVRLEWCVPNWTVQTGWRLVCAGGIGRKDEKQTWMLSGSDRQASIVTVLGWFGTRTVERDLPPNRCEMGESTELAYSYVSNVKRSAEKERIIDTPCSLLLSPPQSGPRLIGPLP